eukprot:2699096-Amphidinium_carterae.1
MVWGCSGSLASSPGTVLVFASRCSLSDFAWDSNISRGFTVPTPEGHPAPKKQVGDVQPSCRAAATVTSNVPLPNFPHLPVRQH